MAKIAPQLPIEVDSETGVWTSDALPMLYVPVSYTHLTLPTIYSV